MELDVLEREKQIHTIYRFKQCYKYEVLEQEKTGKNNIQIQYTDTIGPP